MSFQQNTGSAQTCGRAGAEQEATADAAPAATQGCGRCSPGSPRKHRTTAPSVNNQMRPTVVQKPCVRGGCPSPSVASLTFFWLLANFQSCFFFPFPPCIRESLWARARAGQPALMLGGPGQHHPAGQCSPTGPGHQAWQNASSMFSDSR